MILLMGFSIRVECNFTSKAKKCTQLIDSYFCTATSSKSVNIRQDYVFLFLSKWQVCKLVSRMEWIFSQASFCSSPQMNLYPFFRRLEIGFVTSARSGKKWLSCCRAPNSDHTSFTDVGGDKCFRAVILPWFGQNSSVTYNIPAISDTTFHYNFRLAQLDVPLFQPP